MYLNNNNYWKFRASYEPIKSLPLHLHCMPTGQPCIWLIVMSLEYMYPWGIDFVLIIIWLWVQLMIYTTGDIWKFSQIAWAFKRVQFERIFKYCKRCKSLIARVFRYDYSFIIWPRKLQMCSHQLALQCKLKINDKFAWYQSITMKFSHSYDKNWNLLVWDIFKINLPHAWGLMDKMVRRS